MLIYYLAQYEKYVHSKLKEYGYKNTVSILNEWNPEIQRRRTLADSAYVSEMMLKKCKILPAICLCIITEM